MSNVGNKENRITGVIFMDMDKVFDFKVLVGEIDVVKIVDLRVWNLLVVKDMIIKVSVNEDREEKIDLQQNKKEN